MKLILILLALNLVNCWTCWNWLSLRSVDQLSRSLALEVFWNGSEGERRGSRLGEILSIVPANYSSKRGKSRLQSWVHTCF